MENKTSVDSLKTKIDKLSFLHEVGHTINSMQDIPNLLDYSLQTALFALESSSGSIFLWDEDKQELKLSKVIGREDSELDGIRKKLGEGIVGSVAATKKPILVKNIHTDPRFQPSQFHQYQSDSFLCVPLIARNKLIGVINITEKTSCVEFNADELEFLYILANHLAIAADNIHLHKRAQEFTKYLEQKVREATEELKKTVDTLCVLKRYKEDILESLATGIYVLDRQSRITLWNRGMEMQYGMKREDALGKYYFDVLADSRPQELKRAIEDVQSRGTSIVLENMRRRTESFDEPRVTNYHIFPLRTEDDDQSLGVVVLLEDVTEKVSMQRQLLINEKMAAVGKLSAGIAHELNNPLDGTRRYLNLALDALNGYDNPVPSEFILNAKEGVNRMIKIVRSLLDFVRQTGHVQAKVVGLSALLQETIRSFEEDIRAPHIKLEMHLPSEEIFVKDYGLQHVVTNLLKNAADAMREGGKITVTCFAQSEGSVRQAELLVQDQGVGMPAEELEHVFEPFYTTKKAGEGTGLGLAICQEIIARSNGRIHVKSQLGKGTLFKIVLPLAQAKSA